MSLFRALRADEVDCRISQIKKDGQSGKPSGLSLLLYKDARCDQNILDETVTPWHWKREHSRDNRNCTVSIWCEELGQWISKEDTGTESNTEKEKGLASDSFKRACFNWGIGRELYTAPFIWIKATDCNIKEYNGKLSCYDNFSVTKLESVDGVITELEIKNEKTGKTCYRWKSSKGTETPKAPDNSPETQMAPAEPEKPKVEVMVSNKVPELSPTMEKLSNELTFMATAFFHVTMPQMKAMFNDFKKSLVSSGHAPDKIITEYTMEEIDSLIAEIKENFCKGDAA